MEVILSVEDGIDGAHQEGEERETKEFQDDGEHVLFAGFACVVSITYSRDDLEDPINGEDVLSGKLLVLEIVVVHPRFVAG